MKYFIFHIAGKQLVIKPETWYDIDHIKTGKIGDLIILKRLLFYQNENKIQIGQPFLKNAVFGGQILNHIKGQKLIILKTKPKKNYKRVKGHRQIYTRILF